MQTSFVVFFFFLTQFNPSSQEVTIWWQQSDSTQLQLMSTRTKTNYLITICTCFLNTKMIQYKM